MQALFALTFLSCISVGKWNDIYVLKASRGFFSRLFWNIIQVAILDRLRLKYAVLVRWLRLNRSFLICTAANFALSVF